MTATRPRRTMAGFALAALVAAGGCAGGARPTPAVVGPSSDASPDASDEVPSPTISVDPQLCEALSQVASRLAGIIAVKLRTATTRGELEQRFEDLSVTMTEARRYAPSQLTEPVRTLAQAVTDLGLAVEDYRTTGHTEQAAPTIAEKAAIVDKALRSLRIATDCPD